jgi:DNA-binding NtrC family response regulator
VLAVAWHAPDQRADGLAAVRALRAADPDLPVILLTQRGSEEIAVAALRLGVADYFTHPVSADALGGAARRLARAIPTDGAETHELIGSSAHVRALRRLIERVAAAPCNVLITGETGTGKELVASLVHRLSARSKNPYLCLNCAAVPDALLESELFGHERGAFTGAHASVPGKLKSADGGTVLLDEIGELSLAGQAKLLRAIESREVVRLGASKPTRTDVRIIAATNRALEPMVRDGRFRLDLFYRLNVVRIGLAPLREHREDLPLLVEHYLRLLAPRFGRTLRGLSPEALALLGQHDWPGNVRELRNVLESAFVNVAGPIVEAADLPFHASRSTAPAAPLRSERDALREALERVNWNKTRAADMLRWSRMTVYRKMAKYDLSDPGSRVRTA